MSVLEKIRENEIRTASKKKSPPRLKIKSHEKKEAAISLTGHYSLKAEIKGMPTCEYGGDVTVLVGLVVVIGVEKETFVFTLQIQVLGIVIVVFPLPAITPQDRHSTYSLPIHDLQGKI